MENTLAIIDGSTARERLLIVLCFQAGQGSRVELRQQSWGDGVGWFTQSSVSLEPHQVAQLKNTLGSHRGANNLPAECSRLSSPSFAARVVHADTA